MTEVGDGPAPLPAMVPVEMASQVVEITAGADFDRLIEQYTEAEDFHSPILAMGLSFWSFPRTVICEKRV